jgi:hypothetical protein
VATKLEKPLRREITIGGQPFVVTLAPEGFKLVGKGRRKGLEIRWEELVSGEAALATALQASITGDIPLAPSKRNIKADRESSASPGRNTPRKVRRKTRASAPRRA